MFCQTCGDRLTDAFCSKCGAPAGQPFTPPEQKRRAQVVMYIVLAIIGVIGLLVAMGMVASSAVVGALSPRQSR